MKLLLQSTAVTLLAGPFNDPATGLPVTGADIDHTDVILVKNNNVAGAAAKNDATDNAAHVAGGVYKITLDATDTGTLGPLEAVINLSADANTPMVVREYFGMVVTANVYNSLVAGTDVLDVSVIQWLGVAITQTLNILFGWIAEGTLAAGGAGGTNTFTLDGNNLTIGDWLYIPSKKCARRVLTFNTGTFVGTVDTVWPVTIGAVGYLASVNYPAIALVAADFGDGALTLAKFGADTFTALFNTLGAFTATGVNTVLGFFKALFKKDAATPSDIGGTFNPATDALEAQQEHLGAPEQTGAASAAVGSLNNLSSAEAQAADAAALAAYNTTGVAKEASVLLVKAKSDLIPAAPAAVGDVPTAALNAAAVLAAAAVAPIAAAVKKINTTTVNGDGSATPWGP